MNNVDNLSIKGIESDTSHGKFKPRGKQKKPYIVESRIDPPKDPRSVFHSLGLQTWWVHGRYTTAARRDQAYASLVKKERNSRSDWASWEYRKVDM